MCKDKEEKEMGIVAEKKSIRPLNNEKKMVLKNFIGKSSSRLDLNKVRDQWKYEKN